MTFAGKNDKDRKNKLLLFNLFWKNGFIPRIEIPIYEYVGDDKFGNPLTDLDVFAWKYIPFIGIIKLTGSAKGDTPNVSHRSEIFKLKGVNEYFNPFQSFYVHDSSPTDELYWFGKKLGIEILSKASISSMTKRLKGNFNFSEVGANSLCNSILLTKKLNKYDFITSLVWLSKNPDKIYKIEALLIESIKKYNNIDEKNNLLLLLYLISIYLFSITEIIEKIQNVAPSDLQFKLKWALYGGKEIYNTVVDVIDVINTYLEKKYEEKSTPFNYENFIPKFKLHSLVINRFFLQIEAIFIAIRCIDFILLYYAEYDTILDIDVIINDFTNSEVKKGEALGVLRHLFLYFKENLDPNFEKVAKKINLMR